MKYDIARLEADLNAATEKWKAAKEEHHSPREDLQARRRRDDALSERMCDLGDALKGVRHGFSGRPEHLDKMEAILKDYEVKG